MAALPPPAPDLRADIERARAARVNATIVLDKAAKDMRSLLASGCPVTLQVPAEYGPALIEILKRGSWLRDVERQADDAMRETRVAVAEAELALARARAEAQADLRRYLVAMLGVCLCLIWAGAL